MEVDRTRIATVSSPVFWGSFFGITFTSVLGGLSYIQLVDFSAPNVSGSQNGFVIVFLCVLCVRYYASVIFLTYKDALTTEVRSLESSARRSVFWIQFLLIFGCSANASLLPIFGAAAACVVVIFQGLLMMRYWRIVWSLVISEHPQGDLNVLMFIVDIAILMSAIFYFLWEAGIVKYDRGTAGIFLGAVFLGFIGECATSYFRAIRAFVRETRNALRD